MTRDTKLALGLVVMLTFALGAIVYRRLDASPPSGPSAATVTLESTAAPSTGTSLEANATGPSRFTRQALAQVDVEADGFIPVRTVEGTPKPKAADSSTSSDPFAGFSPGRASSVPPQLGTDSEGAVRMSPTPARAAAPASDPNSNPFAATPIPVRQAVSTMKPTAAPTSAGNPPAQSEPENDPFAAPIQQVAAEVETEAASSLFAPAEGTTSEPQEAFLPLAPKKPAQEASASTATDPFQFPVQRVSSESTEESGSTEATPAPQTDAAKPVFDLGTPIDTTPAAAEPAARPSEPRTLFMTPPEGLPGANPTPAPEEANPWPGSSPSPAPTAAPSNPKPAASASPFQLDTPPQLSQPRSVPTPSASEYAPTLQRDTVAMPAEEEAPAEQLYQTQPGDNYWSISKKMYGQGRYFQALAEYNRHRIPNPDRMKPDMYVLIPEVDVLHERYPKLTGGPLPSAADEKPEGFFIDEQGQPRYRVGKGDTLGEIALKHLGRTSRWVQVYGMNRDLLKNPNALKIGLELRLPPDASQVLHAEDSLTGR